MKNITVSVDEETHRLARIRAAELGTSVSALVRDYLKDLTDGGIGSSVPGRGNSVEEAERRHRMLRNVIKDIRAASSGFRAADNLSREELYKRGRDRAESRTGADAERQDLGHR